MKLIFEVSTTQYEEDKMSMIKALSHLQTLCETPDAYQLGKPISRFGWTFFSLWLKPNLITQIEERFSDMISKSKGRKNDEKFTNFMIDFFNSRDCKLKLKLVEEV
ncbi:MAG: hypothetical protein ACE5RN_02985 [Nitrosopumilaceae archaeon]